MKSFKNHLSLVIALLSILFSVQIFTVVERSIDAYKHNLAKNYSLVVVSKKKIEAKKIESKIDLVTQVQELSPDGVIQRLNAGISKKNAELLKITLPKFYKLKFKYYPSPDELEAITKRLLKISSITKVETFQNKHHTTYRLLLLFKTVVTVFSICVMIVTMLLIFKELRIWQFQHNERMSIMGLFGAPTWLRSAVLFRLAIVDALIASALAFVLFMYISSNKWVAQQFENIGISVVVFDKGYDFLMMLSIAMGVSLLLATLIVLGHKEEV